MPISQFKEKFVARLKIDRIKEPENILDENNFEQKFVVPIAIEINKTETDVFLFGHPWGKRVRCTPDCKSAREGKGHIQEGCYECWRESKGWGTVNAYGTQNNFDLVAVDTKNGKLAVEIKFVSFTKGRRPNGEIQRFLGQCALATSKFDFVIGVCGYRGILNPEYDRDTEKFKRWAEEHNIDIVFRSVSTEYFQKKEVVINEQRIATFGSWRWITGKVDTYKEHVKIRYGDTNKSCWDDFITVALLSPPEDQTYTVEFLVAPEVPYEAKMINAVKKELDFFLIEKGEEDPWAYIKYHCGTASNLYSMVHWIFSKKVRK